MKMTPYKKELVIAAIERCHKAVMMEHGLNAKYPWKKIFGPRSMFLKPDQLAFALQISPKTLEKWREKGIGPKFLKMGKGHIRYAFSDLDSWLDEQIEKTEKSSKSGTSTNKKQSNDKNTQEDNKNE